MFQALVGGQDKVGKGPSFLYFLEASDRMAKGRDGTMWPAGHQTHFN